MIQTLQARSDLIHAQTVVVKLGSSLLVKDTSENTAAAVMANVAADIASIQAQGRRVVVVSSGAIALGYPRLGEKTRPTSRALAQAAAAMGQLVLMNRWQAALEVHELLCAQVLLTHDDADDRRRYVNARRAIGTLIRKGIIPVINENDSVATDEIRFGDNDALAASVTGLLSADVLVVLTEVNGCYDKDPTTHKDAQRLPLLTAIDEDRLARAGGAAAHGTGGMRSKLVAAQTASGVHGAACVIASGRGPGVLSSILAGQDLGTFVPATARRKKRARARWLRADPRTRGEVVVDEGAKRALLSGNSLLLAGVTGVRGRFTAGDVVNLCDPWGTVFARGITQASRDDIEVLKGLRTDQVEATGRAVPEPLIHRDDFVAIE